MRRLLVPVLVLLAVLVAPAQAGAIVRGFKVTNPGAFPWQVALNITTPDGGALCGGTLIRADRVLTAAHCTVGQAPADIVVVGGAPDRFAGQVRAVAEIANHPQTVQDGVPAPRNDVAVLVLAQPFVAPAAPIGIVPAGTDLVGDLLTVSGWGLVAPDELAETNSSQPGTVTRTLRETQVVGQPDTDCSTAYGPTAFRSQDMVCAAGNIPTDRFGNVDNANGLVNDSCGGDSGGPLAAPQVGSADPATPSHWLVAGVVSWGAEDCGIPEAPGVYAKLGAASLNSFANNPTFQPENTAAPSIDGTAKVGSTVTCRQGAWTHAPTSVDRLLLRLDGPADLTPEIAAVFSYTLADGDAGRFFGCLETATNAGGTASAMSSLIGPVAAADAAAPTQTTPVTPSPPPVESVLVAPDRTAPTTRVTSRRCVRRRCRLLVRVRDRGSSGAVRSLQATLSRRTGSRTRRAKVTIRRLSSGLYELRTRRLARARWTLRFRATDLAGNARRSTAAFRVR